MLLANIHIVITRLPSKKKNFKLTEHLLFKYAKILHFEWFIEVHLTHRGMSFQYSERIAYLRFIGEIKNPNLYTAWLPSF